MCMSCVCTCVPGGDRVAWSDQWDLWAWPLTQSFQGWGSEPGLGWVSPGSYLAEVLALAMAAGQTESPFHTQLRKVAASPGRQCGGHSGPGSSALDDGGSGRCLSQGHHSAWGRTQSLSRVVAHPWGHTAEWPLVPRTPHSCERRVFTQVINSKGRWKSLYSVWGGAALIVEYGQSHIC